MIQDLADIKISADMCGWCLRNPSNLSFRKINFNLKVLASLKRGTFLFYALQSSLSVTRLLLFVTLKKAYEACFYCLKYILHIRYMQSIEITVSFLLLDVYILKRIHLHLCMVESNVCLVLSLLCKQIVCHNQSNRWILVQARLGVLCNEKKSVYIGVSVG